MVSDGKRMERRSTNALLRIPVSPQTALFDVAQHIHKIAFPDDNSEYKTCLYVISNGIFSRLPLSLNTKEFIIMTHQSNEAEIRYSFEEALTRQVPQQKVIHVVEKINPSIPLPPMAEPIIPEIPPLIDRSDSGLSSMMTSNDFSINITTGISIFQNSLGFQFSQFGSQFNVKADEEPTNKVTKSLKNELESLISQKK